MCINAKMIMYADDTVVYIHGKTVKDVARKLTEEMEKISIWLKNSHLTLNVDKTVSMFFTNRRKFSLCKIEPKIIIEGQEISRVDQIKYLGVVLDSHLNFKKHIKKITNTLRINIAHFRYIRNSLTIDAFNLYLNAMIIPHFRYCMTSWSQACKTALRPLESLFKSSLKVHDKKSWLFHHCHILKKHGILSFENIIIYSNLCLLLKIINGTAAPPLKKFISLSSEITSRATRSTVRGECRIPQCKTAFGSSAFSSVAIR